MCMCVLCVVVVVVAVVGVVIIEIGEVFELFLALEHLGIQLDVNVSVAGRSLRQAAFR